MKKFIKISFLLLATGIFFSTVASGQQKLGYIDPSILLLKMPERVSADEELKSLGESYTQKIQAKVEALKKKEEELYKLIESKTLSPIAIRERKEALQTEYQGIVTYEKEASTTVEAKRVALYEPITKKVQNAIDEVSKSEGYTMVFDASVGVLLHAEEMTNLTAKVATKLGISLD